MTDEEIQQLIEQNLNKDEQDQLQNLNKDEAVYTAIFEELNKAENIEVPYLFSEKIIEEAYYQEEQKEEAKTRLKTIGLTSIALLISGVAIYTFEVEVLSSISSSYFLYGTLLAFVYFLTELADFYLIKNKQ
ncbi:MAG: hypothetical protein N4A35_08495 [Flavobacteriales bacterium]|jgi:hypothetical protein|nr:hypothetical protein [Flavobacteriales bacterium]